MQKFFVQKTFSCFVQQAKVDKDSEDGETTLDFDEFCELWKRFKDMGGQL